MPQRSAIILALLCVAVPAAAQSVVRDDFEGPEPTLHEAGGDGSYKIEVHRRVPQGAHSGRWCEQLKIVGNNGTYVFLSHPIADARVIGELAPSVWLKADRPGLQIVARVVLPRSKHPRTLEPLTTLIRGAAYKQVGVWQQLRIDNLPRQLEAQVRVLRIQFGPQVDPREAYVDRILLNVYGGPGTTNVWIDDLEVAGVVAPEQAGDIAERRADQSGPLLLPPTATAIRPGGASAPRVELRSRLLLVDGKPFFPRVIDYRGEPLARLKAVGFNAVRVTQPPTPELLAEAASEGLWLVAPPPPVGQLEPRADNTDAVKIGTQFDPVLAWDLGSGLASRDLPATKHWSELVQDADPRERPLVCDADSDLANYTQYVKLLLARREPLGTTSQLNQYAPWLRERAQLARAGTPLWATIQTEPLPQLVEQIRLLAPERTAPSGLQESQIRTLVHAALASRSRGLCFTSNSRLDSDDLATQRRAAILELINLELQLIERWPAAGSSSPNANTNAPHATGAVLKTDRSRLLLPIVASPNSQFAQSNPATPAVRFLVSGVPEGDDAYELSLTSFRPLKSQRVPGGTQVELGEADRDSLVVFTQDQVVIHNLKDTLAKIAPRAAQLARDVANAELVLVEGTEYRLAELGQAAKATGPKRLKAQNDLRQCESLLKTDVPKAYYQARHAQQFLREIQRAHWDRAAPTTAWPLADPFTANFATLPEHYRFANEMASATHSANRLPEGNFEDLDAMSRAGWKHFQHRQERITTAVELSPQAAHSGRAGLLLRAVANDPENKPGVVETPPLWVTSAPVNVHEGDLLHIQGWLRIAQPITGSVDGLLVIDTLSGEALAQRVVSTDDWRQFSLFRCAPRSGPMAVTFALSGLGEAWIDDVTIQLVTRASPPQQAQTTPPPAAAAAGR
jgi:hypothetical protein